MTTKDAVPQISVIIPTHLRAELVGRAVESAFAQRLRPIEVVVVDDAADADTRAVVAALVAKFGDALSFVAVDSTQAGGASASRNAGAAVSRGDLLAFLDDDDWWDPEYLGQAYDTMQATGAELVVTPSWMVVDGEKEPWLEPTQASFRTFRPGVSGSNILIEKQAFESVGGFDAGMWVMNDVDFFLRLRDKGVRMAAAKERLVFNEGRGTGHLMSPSERRARGLEHFLAVHGPRLDRSGVRLIRRRIHAARINPDSSADQRVRHWLGLLWNSTFNDYRGTIARRIKGRRRAH